MFYELPPPPVPVIAQHYEDRGIITGTQEALWVQVSLAILEACPLRTADRAREAAGEIVYENRARRNDALLINPANRYHDFQTFEQSILEAVSSHNRVFVVICRNNYQHDSNRELELQQSLLQQGVFRIREIYSDVFYHVWLVL